MHDKDAPVLGLVDFVSACLAAVETQDRVAVERALHDVGGAQRLIDTFIQNIIAGDASLLNSIDRGNISLFHDDFQALSYKRHEFRSESVYFSYGKSVEVFHRAPPSCYADIYEVDALDKESFAHQRDLSALRMRQVDRVRILEGQPVFKSSPRIAVDISPMPGLHSIKAYTYAETDYDVVFDRATCNFNCMSQKHAHSAIKLAMLSIAPLLKSSQCLDAVKLSTRDPDPRIAWESLRTLAVMGQDVEPIIAAFAAGDVPILRDNANLIVRG